MKRRTVIFGPPGTGKTTTVLGHVARHLKAGVAPERIGFVSFSRRAVQEAKDRIAVKVELPHFRTIHATAYHLLELTRADVVNPAHLREFGSRIGVPFTAHGGDIPVWEGALGDKCLGLAGLAHARQTDLYHEWRQAQVPDLPWALVRDVVGLYEKYKATHGLRDFHDMIRTAEGTLDLDVLVVDEFQDTSPAQLALLRRVASHVPTVYFAGDDDQAIHRWAGADPDQLLRLKGTQQVLPQSHRLPLQVKRFAERISRQITQRVPKEFRPRVDAETGEVVEGRVRWIGDLDTLDLHNGEKWLLLARSNYQLGQLRELARRQGVVYSLMDGQWSWGLPCVQAAITYERLRRGKPAQRAAVNALQAMMDHKLTLPKKDQLVWEDVLADFNRERTWMEALHAMPIRDRAYVRALRRGGEPLHGEGRVQIGTVHSAKGAEADHVVLLTDVSERVMTGFRQDPDAERRVQYVAVTRARQTLTLVQPQTQTFWAL